MEVLRNWLPSWAKPLHGEASQADGNAACCCVVPTLAAGVSLSRHVFRQMGNDSQQWIENRGLLHRFSSCAVG
jgi:hypothetical protein